MLLEIAEAHTGYFTAVLFEISKRIVGRSQHEPLAPIDDGALNGLLKIDGIARRGVENTRCTKRTICALSKVTATSTVLSSTGWRYGPGPRRLYRSGASGPDRFTLSAMWAQTPPVSWPGRARRQYIILGARSVDHAAQGALLARIRFGLPKPLCL